MMLAGNLGNIWSHHTQCKHQLQGMYKISRKADFGQRSHQNKLCQKAQNKHTCWISSTDMITDQSNSFLRMEIRLPVVHWACQVTRWYVIQLNILSLLCSFDMSSLSVYPLFLQKGVGDCSSQVISMRICPVLKSNLVLLKQLTSYLLVHVSYIEGCILYYS